jgi:DNA-binding protein HU-beta
MQKGAAGDKETIYTARNILLRDGCFVTLRIAPSAGLAQGGARARVASTIEKNEDRMSKAFIASVLQESASLTGTAANRAATDVIAAVVKELKKAGKFTLPGFGTWTVKKTKARKGLNPRTGAAIKVKAGKTVRFKASPTLKKAV